MLMFSPAKSVKLKSGLRVRPAHVMGSILGTKVTPIAEPVLAPVVLCTSSTTCVALAAGASAALAHLSKAGHADASMVHKSFTVDELGKPSGEARAIANAAAASAAAVDAAAAALTPPPSAPSADGEYSYAPAPASAAVVSSVRSAAAAAATAAAGGDRAAVLAAAAATIGASSEAALALAEQGQALITPPTHFSHDS